MPYKLLFIVSILFTLPVTAYAEERVLLIDDAIERSNNSLLFETTLRSYQLEVDHKTTENAVGIEAYDAIFLLGEQVTRLPEMLEEELLAYQDEIIVVGEPPQSTVFWEEWSYGGEIEALYLLEEPLTRKAFIKEVTLPENAEVITTAKRHNRTYPYIAKKDNHYMIASAQVEGMQQFALNKFLGQLFPTEQSHLAFIKLTNINVNTDVVQLEKLTSYLQEHNVSYVLSVDNEAKTAANQTLKSNKKVIDKLVELQSLGARIIVKTSAGNYDQDIRALTQLNLYPIGFETENIPRLHEEYEEMNKFTSLYFGPTNTSENEHVQHILPIEMNGIASFEVYPTTIENRGRQAYTLMPEQQAELLARLPKSLISYAYPSYLELQPLQDFVETLKELPHMHWIDWTSEEHTTRTTTETITFTQDGKIDVQLDKPMMNKVRYLWEDKSTDTILWLLAIFVLLFVLLFAAYIVYMRVRLRKRLFNERK